MKNSAIYLFVSICLISLICSCVKQEMFVEPEQQEVLALHAQASPSASTKTTLHEGEKVLWAPHDSIRLFIMSADKSKEYCQCIMRADNETAIETATFYGVPGDYDKDDFCFVAVYPASITSYEGVDFPSVQQATTGDMSNFYSVAVSDNENLVFQNLLGGICFSVERRDIRSIEIWSMGDRKKHCLAGSYFNIEFNEDGTPNFRSYSSHEFPSQNSLTVTPPDGDYFVPGKNYYVSLPPFNFSSGLSITYRTDSQKATFSTDKALSIKRSVISWIKPLDKDLVFTDEIIGDVAYISLSQQDYPEYRNNQIIKKVVFEAESNKKTAIKVSVPESEVYMEIINQELHFYSPSKYIGITDGFPLYYGIKDSVEEIDMGSFVCSGNASLCFRDMKNLKSIDLSKARISDITNLAGMFSDCESLETIDISSIDTSNATTFEAIFSGCRSLKHIELGNINTSKVTNFGGMFHNCESLEEIDLSKLATRNATIFNSMFYGCKSLKSIDLSSFETPSLTECFMMFAYCSSLESIDVSNFDFSRVTRLPGLFCECSSLKSINLGVFDISSREEWDTMFYGVATRSQECDVICGRESLDLIYKQSDQNMFRSSRRFLTWYTPDSNIPVITAPDFSHLYNSTDYSKDKTYRELQLATEGIGIDIVIMGDAYSDRLIADGTYDNDANRVMEALFSDEPFKSFRNMFNVYLIYAVSCHETTEGITRFLNLFNPGNAEVVIGEDDITQEYGDLVIGSSRKEEAVYINMIHSDEISTSGKVRCTRDKITDYGSGLATMYISVLPESKAPADFQGLVLHEFGHAFGKFDDEYLTMNGRPDPTIAEINTERHKYGYGLNVTYSPDPELAPWSHFLKDPRYADSGLGLYEGAYYTQGIWRATENSYMQHSYEVKKKPGYNAPMREAIYKRIHKLAYGPEWEYSYEDFVQYDLKNIESVQ